MEKRNTRREHQRNLKPHSSQLCWGQGPQEERENFASLATIMESGTLSVSPPRAKETASSSRLRVAKHLLGANHAENIVVIGSSK